MTLSLYFKGELCKKPGAYPSFFLAYSWPSLLKTAKRIGSRKQSHAIALIAARGLQFNVCHFSGTKCSLFS